MPLNSEGSHTISAYRSSWLFHGVLVAVGTILSVGLAYFAFSGSSEDSEKSESKKKPSPAGDSSPCGRIPGGDDRRTATFSQVSPCQSPAVTDRVVDIVEPFCGVTADWVSRPPRGYHSSDMDTSILRERPGLILKRKSVPVAGFLKQRVAKAQPAALRTRCRKAAEVLQTAQSSNFDTLSSDCNSSRNTPLGSESTALTEKSTDEGSPVSNSTPPTQTPVPLHPQIAGPVPAKGKLYTLLGILGISEAFDILKKYSVDTDLINMGLALHSMCLTLLKRKPSAQIIDGTNASQILSLDSQGVTWDSILLTLTKKLKDKSGLKSKLANQLFGMKISTVVECKSCDACVVEEEKCCWSFPVDTALLGSSPRRYTLLSCLKKNSEPVKVRGENWGKCSHKGNLFKRKLVTSFPDLLLFERSPAEGTFLFPPFPLVLDLSGVTTRKEIKPRYKLYAVTMAMAGETSCGYFKFEGEWFGVDDSGKVEKMRIASEEKFHTDKLMMLENIMTLVYFKEVLWRPEGQQL